MQEEIIEKIKEEQLRIQQELAKENKELIFFEQFLRKIDFSNITTYSKVSIEELIMAYIRSETNELSLEEIKEITNGIIPIFEKYTAEDIHSLLLLIDDLATAENYEEIMGVLYSEDKVDILEGLIEVRDVANKTRVVFDRIGPDTYAIITAFTKNIMQSHGYHEKLERKIGNYRTWLPTLKANLENEEFMAEQENYEQELWNKLSSSEKSQRGGDNRCKKK